MSQSGTIEGLLRRDRAVVIIAVVAICIFTSFYTLFGVGVKMSALEMTAMAINGPMDTMVNRIGYVMKPVDWSASYAALVFVMWWIMMIAMMLPSAAPTILLYAALIRKTAQGPTPSHLALVFLSGYLVIWAAFSVVASGFQWLLELNSLVSPTMMTLTSELLGGTVLLAAGIYQLTALKRACLDHCRSPMQFLLERRRAGLAGAFSMGLEHGLYCLGCCWFLMALLFFGGIMNLYWITGLAVLVAVEKLAPGGRKFAKASGAMLMAGGLWMLLHAVN